MADVMTEGLFGSPTCREKGRIWEDLCATQWIPALPSLEEATRFVRTYISKGAPVAAPLSDVPCVKKVVNFLYDNFARIDADHNGRIFDHEIRDAKKMNNWSGDEQKMLGAACDMIWDLEGYAHPGKSGLNGPDFEKLNEVFSDYRDYRKKQMEAVPHDFELCNFALTKFDAIDTNQDGRLARGEIDQAISSTTDTGERLLLQEIRFKYNKIMYPNGRSLFSYRSTLVKEDFDKYLWNQYALTLGLSDMISQSWTNIQTYDVLAARELKLRESL